MNRGKALSEDNMTFDNKFVREPEPPITETLEIGTSVKSCSQPYQKTKVLRLT